jgi:hypothetical protein
MVLAHCGDVRTEAELRTLLDTTEGGTRARNVMRVSSPAFEVYFRSSNLGELRHALAANKPVIVFMQTGALAYWNMDIFHTAVLIGLDDTTAAPTIRTLRPHRRRHRWTPSRKPGRKQASWRLSFGLENNPEMIGEVGLLLP